MKHANTDKIPKISISVDSKYVKVSNVKSLEELDEFIIEYVESVN